MTEQQNVAEIIGKATVTESVETMLRMAKECPAMSAGIFRAVAKSEDACAALVIEAGKQLWRMGMRGDALSAYERAAVLDPAGPAKLLLEHSNSIMDFFNPDLLNP